MGRFADAFRKDTCNVTTAEIQAWLDARQLSPQSYANSRTVLHTFFEFAVARGYASDNPVAGVERVKVRNAEKWFAVRPEAPVHVLALAAV